MVLSKKFLSSLQDVVIPNHKKLAFRLIRLALRDRKKLHYMGNDETIPMFVIGERHFKTEVPEKHHDKLPKFIDEMRRYMLWTNLAHLDSPVNQIWLTAEAIDLGESHWWDRHPIWFGTLIGGLISFLSGLFLALIKSYWLTGT